MRNLLYIVSTACLIISCSPKTEHQHEETSSDPSDSPNIILYNEVMDIHDEVMPRMEELYNFKKDLQQKISSNPTIAADEKAALEARIVRIDSASQLMMDFMHEFDFDIKSDTVDSEPSRAYLESQMEKARRMKEAILETIKAEGGN